MIVGSRGTPAWPSTSWAPICGLTMIGFIGDVQPYVALGKELLKDGHRIRIATHETFRDFVTGEGLEFYNIGGNPQDLMSYMVKSEHKYYSHV